MSMDLGAAIAAMQAQSSSRSGYVGVQPSVSLSDEQQAILDAVKDGSDVIVDAALGSGKTTVIQEICNAMSGQNLRILYLTYSKLLKADAQRRVRGAWVQNYHGVVYKSLLEHGIRCGISESIAKFNENFKKLSKTFPRFDLIVIDEYQDINEEYAQLLRNIKSLNPMMQVVMVGDLEQKVRSDTVLDVQRFAKEFCDEAVHLPLTRSFRMGKGMGEVLSIAWNKPITGVNPDQEVVFMSYVEAVHEIMRTSPGDLLCLGYRKGAMADALNYVESRAPSVYNKNTVYASIRDSDERGTYDDKTAVFTTFDGCKGMERDTVIVFDYDESYWDVRGNMPGTDPVILRNVFLVAASRAKKKVVFVAESNVNKVLTKFNLDEIGYIPISRFTDLSDIGHGDYNTKPVTPSDAFDFKYIENVESCFSLLKRKRLDDGTSEHIEVNRVDGLIDLSPAVGRYQEAVFFEGYNPHLELSGKRSPIVSEARRRLGKDVWKNVLVLTAVDTEQVRYMDQVTNKIDSDVMAKIVDRLGEHLDPQDRNQVIVEMFGQAARSRLNKIDMSFGGVLDAVKDDTVYELKFVTELSHPMFLQLALYMVMSGLERGVLWNTRTNERWEVTIPDKGLFMNEAINCITKQAYTTWIEGI